MKKFLLSFLSIFIFQACMVGSINDSGFNYNDMLSGNLVYSDEKVEVESTVIFQINNIQTKSEIILGKAKVVKFEWDLNCNKTIDHVNKVPFFEYKFNKLGTYTMCVNIQYYYAFNENKIWNTNLNNNLSLLVHRKMLPANLFISPIATSNFGQVDVSYNSMPLTFLISNIGERTATIVDTGLQNSVFKYTGLNFPGTSGTCSNIVEANTSCFLEIYFNPNNVDLFYDNLLIIYNDPKELNKTVEISLEGEGVDETFYLVAGFFDHFSSIPSRISLLNPIGEHSVFDPGKLGGGHHVYDIGIQSDGKVVIGGNNYCETDFNCFLARINQDGSRDMSWIWPNAQPGGTVTKLLIDSDDKILISGSFNHVNEINKKRIARLNYDGSVDMSFDVGTGPNLSVNSLVGTNDNKYLVAGFFTSFNNIAKNRIVRLNYNGSIDDTFDIGIGANDTIRSIALQDDGKIIIAGSFTNFNGVEISKIARLNSNGSLDLSFSPPLIDGAVFSVSSQINHKIVISGNFTRFDNILISKIARLNSDGSLDSSFNAGIGPNQFINSILINNDKIIVVGNFTSFSSFNRKSAARLNSDGSIDTSFFNTNEGFDSDILVIKKY